MTDTERTKVYRMSTGAHPHPFQVGPIVTLQRLQRRLQTTEGDVLARLWKINETFAKDKRFTSPVVRQVEGGLVYFDRHFYDTQWRDVVLNVL